MGKCKDCVTWLMVGTAAIEALEHNAIVGDSVRDIGQKIKQAVSKEEWEDIVYELDWFEHPITEFTADFALSGSLKQLEKCDLDVDKAWKLFKEGCKANEEGKGSLARSKYIAIKDEFLKFVPKLTCVPDGQEK